MIYDEDWKWDEAVQCYILKESKEDGEKYYAICLDL